MHVSQFSRFLLAIAVALCSLDALAQAASAASAPTAEVQVLRAQLEAMRFFHDSFISMVQWALGTAIAVVLSLAVFGWFTSKANYERDRDLLRQQAQTLKDEITALVTKNAAESRQELEAALTARNGPQPS